MATRKFLFMNQTDGYSEEQAAADELSLGKITLSGVSGVSLEVGGGTIQNVGAPVNANDAARKAYVDSGLATESQARAGDIATVNTAITAEATVRASADTTLQSNVIAEANARIAADAALQVEIDAEETARAGAVTTLTSSLSAEQAARIAADAALQSGLSSEATARAAADAALQAEINAEEVARADAITTLTTNLSAEQAARIAADNLLATNYAAADSALSTSLTSAYQVADSSIRVDFAAADTQLRADYIAADVVVLNSAKSYADSLQSGFVVKEPARAIASSNITLSGTQTVDGVALVAGDRILVAGQTDAKLNGIYVVVAGAWARSQDLNDNADMKDGVSVFVGEGTVYADSTWVLITNNPIEIGVSDITFIQFSGLGQITAGLGLSKTGNTLNVEVGNGIAISADAVAIKLGTYPGLQFTQNGSLNVKLASDGALDVGGPGMFVKYDPAKALGIDVTNGLQVHVDETRGLAIDAAEGVYVDLAANPGLQFTGGKLDHLLVSADRLSKSALGLDVVGVPLQFKVNGVATAPNVTATGLTQVTAGADYSADSYHHHAMLRGSLLAGETIAASRAVYISAANTASVASCSATSTARVVGLTTVGAGAAGMPCLFNGAGVTSISGVSLTAGTPYYLGSNGAPVEFSALAAGDRVIRLGFGINPTQLDVMIQDMGAKA